MPRQWTKWEKAEMFLFAGPVTAVSITILALLVFSVFSTLFFVFSPHRPRGNAWRAACQSNLKQVALASLHYLQDNGAYPLAQNPPNPAWVEIYASSFTNPQAFQCRLDENATDSQKNSYGYNAHLSGEKIADGKNAVSIILNFEVKADAGNRTQTGKTPAAVTVKERHLEGANYSFADGHVKWLRPERVDSAKPNGENFTFAVE